jgi:hypothetical protein
MSPATIRSLLRWSHLIVGIMIGIYICSPLHGDPLATLVVRLSLLPVLALTGIAMWQQLRLRRLANALVSPNALVSGATPIRRT